VSGSANPLIHVLITGGTIDKTYHPPSQVHTFENESILPAYLQDVIKPHLDLRFETLCLLDSNDINDALHAQILERIVASDASYVLVTHGTDRMTETAAYLDGKTGDKVVILTGGMIPLKEFAMSDGGFNLGFALASLLSHKPGVYVAMNAQCFPAGTAYKNFEIARFEELA